MYFTGPRIEVPPRDNIKGWSLLYDFLTEPGGSPQFASSCQSLDPARHVENQHYEHCSVRKLVKSRPGGCERCDNVEKRMVNKSCISHAWNDVVYCK